MAEQTELDGVQIGSRWKRNPPGREVVEVRRVWTYFDRPYVRAHPTNGGRPIVAPITWLREHYIETTPTTETRESAGESES